MTYLRLALLTLGLLLAGHAVVPATGQEPTPQPTPEWPRCMEGFGGQPGNRTIAVDFNYGTLVTLPAGSFQQLVMPPNSRDFALCHVESGAVVTISSRSCEEVSRRAATPLGNAVVDQLVASCRVPAVPPAEPRCHGGAYLSGGQDVALTFADIAVALPQGEFIIYGGYRGPNTVLVCKTQDNLVSVDYAVVLGSDCSRVEAQWLTEDGAAAVAAIVESCRGRPGAPTPIPPITNRQSETGPIRPPDTGNAGLKPGADN